MGAINVVKGELEIKKVGTNDNMADILTKHVERDRLDRHLQSLSFYRESGHNEIDLKSGWKSSN